MLKGDNTERYGWIVGKDLSALAVAISMVRDIKMKGENIHVFEDAETVLTNHLIEKKLEEQSLPLLLDLLAGIPSIRNKEISVKQEISGETDPNLPYIVAAVKTWLIQEGVVFLPDVTITNIKVEAYADTDEWVVSRIVYTDKGNPEEQLIGFEDIVVMTDAQASGEAYHNLLLPDHNLTNTIINLYDLVGLDKRKIVTSAYDHPFREAITNSIPDMEAASEY